MASVNKVILLGNVGRDPEMRYLPSGKAACSVSVATTSRRKDQNTGDTIEDTQWHRVQFFDRLAEIVGEYVVKGAPIYVEGRLRYGKYTDQSGVEKSTVDIIATELQLLDSRQQGQGDGQQQPQRQQQQRRPQQQQRQAQPQQQGARGGYAPRQGQQQRQAPAPTGGGSSGFDDMDDDIPF